MQTPLITTQTVHNLEELARQFNAAVGSSTSFTPLGSVGVSQTAMVASTLHNRLAALKRRFSVKKHDATRLHYDLRLEWSNVLLSWALPIGPSYYSGDRREAIEMEDHDPANIGFEGVIPEGRYGAGVVMLWDVGFWEPLREYEDIQRSLWRGCLKFRLIGNKLHGVWTLRRHPNRYTNGGQPIWYLLKESDSFARSKSGADVLKDMPNGVLSGRTLNEIEHYWNTGKVGDRLRCMGRLEF